MDYCKVKYMCTIKLKNQGQNIFYRETTKYVQDNLFRSGKYKERLKNETHSKLFFEFSRVIHDNEQKHDVVLEICA